MIRPFTLIGIVCAAGSGLYLYTVKHEVAQLDRQLRDINRQTEQARERTQVLRAEWALLNEPDRLRTVAQRHLSLEPMTPQQFVRPGDLARRLPQAVAFAGAPSLFAPLPSSASSTREVALAAATTAPAAAPAAPPAQEAARPAAPAPEQPRAVAARPAPQAETRVATARPPAGLGEMRPYSEQVPGPTAVARASVPQIMPEARAATRPAPETRTVAARPAAPMQPSPAIRPALHVESQPVRAAAPPAPRVASSLGAPAGGSALGMARPSLPPPVPYSAAGGR